MGGRPKLVLVVDDQRAVAEALAERLAERGYVVRQAHDPDAALAEVARAVPDLAVIDVILPGIGGEVLANRFHDRGIPVILTSGMVDEPPSLPGITFVPKPFDIAWLLTVIEEAIGPGLPPRAIPPDPTPRSAESAPSALPVPATVGILIFDEVEVLDFCGPFEVFASASASATAPDDPATEEERRLFRVVTIAERATTIRCRGGLLVQPHHIFNNHPPLDILVIPGGRGTRTERTNPVLLDWLVAQDAAAAFTTSVCTGAFLLAARGLLDGLRATTHWGAIDWLREHHPAIDVRADERVVDEGHIITSAGVSAGIDMALHLVGRVHGAQVANETARGMEYTWSGSPVGSMGGV